jgi:hypothetical protein
MSHERDQKIGELYDAVIDGVKRGDVPARRRVARVIRVLADILDLKKRSEQLDDKDKP